MSIYTKKYSYPTNKIIKRAKERVKNNSNIQVHTHTNKETKAFSLW